ncbi:MAG TPA: 2-oxoacid:acceptor oxidoreductase family protein [Acidimicrobiales bacterium]|nr:2-oxoacid:acceptor oxidoreductase family protein [Acidimicrobiales bacterium]
MTEREVVLTGIGGQGIQLAAQVLCRAALAEGREIQLFGSYGGMMRGGNTEATVVVADAPVESPPTVGRAWGALVMHHEHFEPVHRLLRPGSVVALNTTVFEGDFDRGAFVVVDVAATELAGGVGNVMAASMVMLGAFSRATGVVALESLQRAVPEALPPYRAQHVALNVAALEAGYGGVDGPLAEAWPARQEVGA